jgi:predicted RND superfamily exporter protein
VKAALQNHMETHPGHTIDVVRSVLDVVPSDQEEKIAVIKKIDGLLTENVIAKTEDRADRDRLQRFKQSLAVRTPITMKDVPEDMIRGFRDADRKLTYFTFVYPKVELVDARNAMAFQVDVAAVKTPLGIYYASSQSMIFADMMRVMIRDGQLAFLVTSLFVFFSLWHDFKSLKITLIIMTPLMFSMLAHILVMKLMGIKFNLYNIIAFPALIGEGMEYSIQYCNRYLEDPKKGPTYAFRTMFRPLLFCSLTSCVGYGGLVLATHPGLRSLGISSTVGVLLALLFALAMTPAIWQLFPHKNNPRRPTHLPKDAEPTSDIQPIFEPSRGTTADSISAAAADERRFRS